ncbi:MAG TPA: hypothetical protein VFB90_04405 [Dehalococcoidia bacterium]|nr:hypothetical protein [Dehalococcoidia bacterium]
MTEKTKADKLAREVDKLIAGLEPHSDDEEIAQLLEVARLRRAEALRAAQRGSKQQEETWKLLLQQLRRKSPG